MSAASQRPSGLASTSGAKVAGKPKSGLGKRLRAAMVENLWLKVISLVFALGFYAFIHSAQNAQRTIQVAIVADMPPASISKVLVTQIPEQVSVTLVGPRGQLDALRGKQIDPIPLDLRAAEDVKDLRITKEMITGLPVGVDVTRIIPSSFEIRWERVIQRSIDVQVAITGQPASGMDLIGDVAVEPKSVIAKGPESAVNVIQLARAVAFDVSGLSAGTHTRSLALDPPPANVDWSHQSVQATVEVTRRLATKEYEVPVEVIGLPRAKTKPPTIRVKVKGPPERIDALRKEDIVATVNPKKSGADTSQPGSAELKVNVVVDGANVSVDPHTILVKW